MALIDNQNIIARTFEVQAAAQQAIYQAEIAQKALAQQIRKEAQEAPDLVSTLNESDAGRSLELLSSEERGRKTQRGSVPARASHPAAASGQPEQAGAPIPVKGHVDIIV